jgi:hypothetical protein
MILRRCTLTAVLFLCTTLAFSQFGEIAKDLGLGRQSQLSDSKLASGLKEALRVGADKSVKLTGRTDGYFANQAIKILVPKNLRPLETGLRAIGYGSKVDEFVTPSSLATLIERSTRNYDNGGIVPINELRTFARSVKSGQFEGANIFKLHVPDAGDQQKIALASAEASLPARAEIQVGRCVEATDFRRLVEAIGVGKIARWWTTVQSPQFRLNRFLTSCPEIISVKDNRVSGTVVTELPFANAGVLTNGG